MTQANSRQMKTENQEYSVSVQHSSSFVTTKFARLLRWMPVHALIPTGLHLWSMHIILFHSTLTFSLEEMLVEWTLWCTAAKSGPACSTVFSMCLLFRECTWALKLPLAPKSRVSLLVYVHLWEGEREGGRRSNSKSWGQDRFKHAGVSLMSCTSLSEHLSYHSRWGSAWKARSSLSAFLLLQYFLWCFLF